MNKYLVVARVNGKDYLVNVEATSSYGAEHEILDRGVCGRHSYGVEGAQAFGYDELSTDTFRWLSLNAKTISFDELVEIINENNDEIIKRDAAERAIKDAERQIKEYLQIIEEASAVIEDIDSRR